MGYKKGIKAKGRSVLPIVGGDKGKSGVGVPKRKDKPLGLKKGRNILGLRKYNRIVQLIRGGGKVDLATFRAIQKEASRVYPTFRGVAVSKITKKKVKSVGGEQYGGVYIKASQIPRLELELERAWWMIGDEMFYLHEQYPEVKLVIQSPLNMVVIEANEVLEPSYSGSKLAEFVELLRIEFENSSGETFTGIATIENKGKEEYVFFGTLGLDFPKNILEIEKSLPPKVKKEIKRRKLDTDKEKIKKQKQKQVLKDIKKKELPKVKEKKEKISDKQSIQLTKQLELVERLFDKGVLSKKELKVKMEEILSKYQKGGIV